VAAAVVDGPGSDETAVAEVRTAARAWFDDNWDPDLTLDEWWDRFGRSGWAFPSWPARAFGKGLGKNGVQIVAEERVRVGAYPAPSGIGPMMAGPTLAEHATAEQIERFLPGLVTGRDIWCQLFSEPSPGSDLASLQSWAERDGDEWVVNGQKVWTSGAQHSRYGILIARTNRDVPKHEGITYFVLDLHQPGVEVRPLKEMTGGATFNEVFFDDARIPDRDRIGDVDRGWPVALTTLSHERKNLGAGGMAGGGAMLGIGIGGSAAAAPSRPDGNARVGDLGVGGAGPALGGDMFKLLPALFGRQHDPLVRQDLARLYTLIEISRYTSLRSKAAADRGDAPGPGAVHGQARHVALVAHDARVPARPRRAGGHADGRRRPDGRHGAVGRAVQPGHLHRRRNRRDPAQHRRRARARSAARTPFRQGCCVPRPAGRHPIGRRVSARVVDGASGLPLR
jgi:alkylation response protein AidB-like acyl-CoA dehydrogenase